MTATKIREMDSNEIETKITELKAQLYDLRFESAVGQLENTAEIKKVKKTIARMKTILNERNSK